MPLKKKVEPKKEKLCKYEINKIIGGDNLFGEYLNKTNLNYDVEGMRTGLEVKYKRIFSYVFLHMYNYINGHITLEVMLSDFNKILELSGETKLRLTAEETSETDTKIILQNIFRNVRKEEKIIKKEKKIYFKTWY